MRLAELVTACDFSDISGQSWQMDPPSGAVDPMLRFCTHRDSSAVIVAHWYAFRFGPFTSVGDTTFRMPIQTLPLLHTFPPDAIGVQALYQVILDSDGAFVDESRVIVHHHDVTDGNTANPWSFMLPLMGQPMDRNTTKTVARWADGLGGAGGTYQPSTLQPGTRGERWGVTTPEDCSFCYLHDFGERYAKPLTRPPAGAEFLHDAYLVDKRPPDSSALTYTYHLGLKLVDLNTPRLWALSEHQLWNPQNLHATLDGFDQALFYVFSHADSYLYYTGRWPIAGVLHASGSFLHGHELHRRSFLFAATPTALGLDEDALELDDFCLPRLASTTHVGTNANLLALLEARCPPCFDERLICQAAGGTTDCKGWRFERGSPFTSLSLFGAERDVGRHEAQHIREAQHIVWFMRYVADEEVHPITYQGYTDHLDDVGYLSEVSGVAIAMSAALGYVQLPTDERAYVTCGLRHGYCSDTACSAAAAAVSFMLQLQHGAQLQLALVLAAVVLAAVACVRCCPARCIQCYALRTADRTIL